MENSIKANNIKRVHHPFLYNLVLYSLTSLITFSFFPCSLWFSFMKEALLSLPKSTWMIFDAKCLFILANIIIVILVGESWMHGTTRSSLASEVYDEYVTRSEISLATKREDIIMKRSDVKRVERKMRISKSMLNLSNIDNEGASLRKVKEKRVEKKLKKEMRTSKSMLNLSEIKEDDVLKNIKVKKLESIHEDCVLQNIDDEDCVLQKIDDEESVDEKLKNDTSKRMLNLSQSMKSTLLVVNKGIRTSKSAVWGGNEILKSRNMENKEEPLDILPIEELNTRVENFIARVNKKRLLEA